jgi:histidinol-phosphatase (PHP family)
MRISYHNHTIYSDGKDTAEAMAQAAYDAGFSHFAFTDHVYSEDYAKGTVTPQEYPVYADHINRLKEQYKGKMRIITGIEADWYKGHGTYMSHYEDVVPLIEFTVGSVHNLMPKNKIYLIDGHLERYVECLEEGYEEALKKW